jgi:hypothetical protein
MLGHSGTSATDRGRAGRLRPGRRRSAAVSVVALLVVPLALLPGAAGAAVQGVAGAGLEPALTSAAPGTLNAVACTTPTSCTAVGSTGSSGDTSTLAEFWNGASWTVETTPNPAGGDNASLDAVSCVSQSSCLAVGSYDIGDGITLLAEIWNGTTWAIEAVPLPSGGLGGNLVGVSCTSASACTAVGYYADSANANAALAEIWNGSDFASETPPTPAGATTSIFDAVSCSSSPSVDCEAVGWDFRSGPEIARMLAEVWNGTRWSIQSAPTPNDASGGSYPTGLSCGSPDACISVGEGLNGSGDLGYGWAQSWNGSKWSDSRVPHPKGATESLLSAVSCSAAPSVACSAVGEYLNGSAFVGYAAGWSGSKWAVQRTPTPKGATGSDLSGVSCSSPPGTCTAVGSDTSSSGTVVTLAEGWNGSKWSIRKTPAP